MNLKEEFAQVDKMTMNEIERIKDCAENTKLKIATNFAAKRLLDHAGIESKFNSLGKNMLFVDLGNKSDETLITLNKIRRVLRATLKLHYKSAHYKGEFVEVMLNCCDYPGLIITYLEEPKENCRIVNQAIPTLVCERP